MTPAGVVGDSKTRLLLAVLAGHRTYAMLMQLTGLSRSGVYYHLHGLRRLGLVDWDETKRGTIHANVRRVA